MSSFDFRRRDTEFKTRQAEARPTNFEVPHVILSPKKAGRVMLPLLSTAAMKGHEEQR